jgi:hypothetical protein
MQSNRRLAIRTLQALALGLAVVLLLAAIPVSTDKPAASQLGKRAPATAPTIGTFTGEYENGVPVYRLPPIAITADRKTEMAKMAREDQLAAAWQDPKTAKPAASNSGN